ncbi:MAG: hypothetical protein ACYCVB_10460 [Bacilli bacterium]
MGKSSTQLESEYELWRTTMRTNKEGFFPIFKYFRAHLRSLSGEALRVFIYMGMVSNNKTGEVFLSIGQIANYSGKTEEDLHDVLSELREAGLVNRLRTEDGTAKTFLLPYGI